MNVRDLISYIRSLGFFQARFPADEYIINDVLFEKREDNNQIVFDNSFDNGNGLDVGFDTISEALLDQSETQRQSFIVQNKTFDLRLESNNKIFDRKGTSYDDPGELPPIDQKPNIIVNPLIQYIPLGFEYDESAAKFGVSASDPIDGDISHKIKLVGLLPAYGVGEHVITYSVENSRGLIGTAIRLLRVYVPNEESPLPEVPELGCNFLRFKIESQIFPNQTDGQDILSEQFEEIGSSANLISLSTESEEPIKTEDQVIIQVQGDVIDQGISIQLESGESLQFETNIYAKFKVFRHHNDKRSKRIDHYLTYNLEKNVLPAPDEEFKYYQDTDIEIFDVRPGQYNVVVEIFRGDAYVDDYYYVYENYVEIKKCDYSLNAYASDCGFINFELGYSALKSSYVDSEGSYLIYKIFPGDPLRYTPPPQERIEVADRLVTNCLSQENRDCLLSEPFGDKLEPEGYFPEPEILECFLTESSNTLNIEVDFLEQDCLEHEPVIERITIIEDDIYDPSEYISTEFCDSILANNTFLRIEGYARPVECALNENISLDIIEENLQIGALEKYPISTEFLKDIFLENIDEPLEIQGLNKIAELEAENGFFINNEDPTIALQVDRDGVLLDEEYGVISFEDEYNQYSNKAISIEYVAPLVISEKIYDIDFAAEIDFGKYTYSVEIYNEDDQPIRIFTSNNSQQIEVQDCFLIQLNEGPSLSSEDGVSLMLDADIQDFLFQQNECALMLEEGNSIDLISTGPDIYIESEGRGQIIVEDGSLCKKTDLSEEIVGQLVAELF